MNAAEIEVRAFLRAYPEEPTKVAAERALLDLPGTIRRHDVARAYLDHGAARAAVVGAELTECMRGEP